MSGEEKRRLMKEQFKKELQQKREFMNKAKGLRRMQNINKALDDMQVQDDSEEWIRKLNEDSFTKEASLDMALETASEKGKMDDLDAELAKAIEEAKHKETFKVEEKTEEGAVEEAGVEAGVSEPVVGDSPAANTPNDEPNAVEEVKPEEDGEERPGRKMFDGL